jgi:UDP-N-acetylglucosamine--dolichyl-phosphate N-acetylglucosaminephosphotransferase
MTPFLRKMKKVGVVGRDAHKLDHPMITEMGGVQMILGILGGTVIGILLMPEKLAIFASNFFTILIAGIIGAIDDLKPLNAKIKPFLTLFACIPILVLGTYTPSIAFPFIGNTRLTIVYPLLIPVVMAVTSNAVNMMDPFNGVMSGTCSVITISCLISALILGRKEAVILSMSLLGVLLAFYYFNRYPSKVFSGDVGSLSIGAALGALAIIGRLELIAVIAFMPQIMNAFYGLSSMGKLYERREVARPTKLLDDGRMTARMDTRAPLTLARFILARGPLFEKDIVKIFLMISAFSGFLAIFTAVLIGVTT